MKDALGHGSNARGDHAQGVEKIGRGNFRLNSHTHEIVAPNGDVAARLRIGKNDGVAVDVKGMGQITRSSGPSLHDAFAMAAYRAKGGNFSAESVPLHYLTGNDFAGHTIREAAAVKGKRKYTSGGY